MMKHPFVKQRSAAPPVTVVVTAAAATSDRGRPGRVGGVRVLSVTAVLFIIHVGWGGAQTQRRVMRYRTECQTLLTF